MIPLITMHQHWLNETLFHPKAISNSALQFVHEERLYTAGCLIQDPVSTCWSHCRK